MSGDQFSTAALQTLIGVRKDLDRAILDLRATEHPGGYAWSLIVMEAHYETTQAVDAMTRELRG